MKKIFLFIIWAFLLTTFYSVNSYQITEYQKESIMQFINSPNIKDLINIKDEKLKYCEEVYLEANRRRSFTKSELNSCLTVFKIKRIQELLYIEYMFKNRGIFY